MGLVTEQTGRSLRSKALFYLWGLSIRARIEAWGVQFAVENSASAAQPHHNVPGFGATVAGAQPQDVEGRGVSV